MGGGVGSDWTQLLLPIDFTSSNCMVHLDVMGVQTVKHYYVLCLQVRFYNWLEMFLSLGVVKYIGPVCGEKQLYVGLHLDSPGKLFF